jgi:hypothetical protein
VADSLKSAAQSLTDLFQATADFLTNLGDDVPLQELQMFHAFKRV